MILARNGKPYVEIAALLRPFARRGHSAAVQFDREADALDRRGRSHRAPEPCVSIGQTSLIERHSSML